MAQIMPKFHLAFGGALCKALGARLPGGGLLFYEEKQAKDF